MRVAVAHAPMLLAEPLPIAACAGESIRMIEARQRYRLPVVAVCNGAPVLRRDWDQALTDADTLLFVTFPGGGEGGTKNIFRTVLNIAIVLVATYFLGPAGAGLTGWQLGAAVAVAQIGAGYIVNAIIPPQPIGSGGALSYEQGSPTYSLGAQGNQARLMQTIPKLYGRHTLTPDFGAAPYTEYSGNDQILYQLFSLGLGSYDVESILIEDTELWNNVDGFTGVFSDIEIELVEPGVEVTLFPANVITSVEVGGSTLKGPNDGGDWIGPFVANTAGTDAKYLALDYVWPGGAFTAKNDGSLGIAATELQAQAREINDAGAAIGDWVDIVVQRYEYATRTPQRISLRIEMEPGRYEVRSRRTNDSAAEGETRIFDAVVWQSLRAYLVGASVFPKETMLAVRALATDQLSSQSARRFRTVQTSKLPVWDGTEWIPDTPTRDIFPIVADMLRNAVYGRGLGDDRLALDDFHSLQATWTAHGDRFDGVFDQKKPLMEAVSDVLRLGRAQPVIIGKMISAVRDEKRYAPRAIFTPRNVIRGSLLIDYVMTDDDTPDDVIVEFFDERTWRFNEVRATLPGSASENPARISLFGCTDRTLAWKHGMYQAAANKYRRRLPSLQTEFDGRPLRRGDMVLLAHPLPKWGRAFDVEGFEEDERALTLSDAVELSGASTNFLRLQKPSGEVWGPVIVTAGDAVNVLVADEADLAAVITAQGDWADFITWDGSKEATVAVIGWGTQAPRECLLVNARSQGDTRVQVSLVVDNDAVYSADAGAPPDETDAPMLPPIPKKPTLTVVNVRIGGSQYAPVVFASWEPAAGADRTSVRISYDHVTWQSVQYSSLNSWSGEVDATTLWIDFRPIGAVAGDRVERFFDLSISEAPPSGVSGISTTVFIDTAFVKFSLPAEDGLVGVLVRYSGVLGFDPESEGTSINYSSPVSQVSVPLETTPTYVRVAPYNVFGMTGLNWSTELAISPRKLPAAHLSDEIVQSLATADTLEGNLVFRKGVGDFIGGMSIVGSGVLGDPIVAAFLVDTFQIAVPTEDAGVFTYVPAFQVNESGEVQINDLIAGNITATQLNALLAEIGTLIGLIIRGPGATIDDALLVIDTTAPYIHMKSAP